MRVQRGSDIDGTYAKMNLGESVSLNGKGDMLAVGGPGAGESGQEKGIARVYRWDGTIWSQVGSDIVGEGAADANGWQRELNDTGDVLAVAAKNKDVDGPVNSEGSTTVLARRTKHKGIRSGRWSVGPAWPNNQRYRGL